MKHNDWSGRTVKFTIGPESLDCYLAIGEVDESNAEDYPHLQVGEPCYFDLTLSRAGEELRVYSLLTTLLTRLILKGESPREALDLLRGQAFEPSGLVAIDGGRLHHYKSIPDLVARYVTDAYYKED
jgi:hypothetical protein